MALWDDGANQSLVQSDPVTSLTVLAWRPPMFYRSALQRSCPRDEMRRTGTSRCLRGRDASHRGKRDSSYERTTWFRYVGICDG